jgi:hypothetical protein
MACRYSVIQYVPDPIADERINIGLVIFDDERVETVFLKRWNRVNCFAMEDIHFLRSFEEQMRHAVSEGLLFPGDRENGELRHERLLHIATSWMNSIQFTEPSGSLATVDQLLERLPCQLLKEPLIKPKRKLRDRQGAAKLARASIRNVLVENFKITDSLQNLLKPSNYLMGQQQQHRFDATLFNGKPYLAAHGISYEVDSPDSTTDAVAWMIADVRAVNVTVPIGILMLPPQPETFEASRICKLYEKKKTIYQNMGAIVLGENDIQEWAIEQLKEKVLLMV